MMKTNIVASLFLSLLLWCPSVFSMQGSQVELAVKAESVPRLSVYYTELPVSNKDINFPLPVHGLSQKFERTSDFFHVTGNVEQAEIIFMENEFILPQYFGGATKIKLFGSFIHENAESDSRLPLRVPVIKNINSATTANGFKVKFVSEFLAGNYRKGKYANTFTLIIKPVV